MSDATIAPDAFGRSLAGFGINLLVAHLRAEVTFMTECLSFSATRVGDDFAILRRPNMVMLLHQDATYQGHPMITLLPEAAARGAGCELRLYDLDPDHAEAMAIPAGGQILQKAMDKPHGLREAFLMSPAGYVWVPSRPLTV